MDHHRKRKIVAPFGVVGLLFAFAATAATADDKTRAAGEAFNGSGRELYGELAKDPGNVVLSPYSIGAAMAMALAATRGATETETARVLKLHLARPERDEAITNLIGALGGYAKGCSGDDEPKAPCLKLTAANALFLTKSAVEVSKEYQELLTSAYKAEVFRGSSLDEINDWVGRKTEGKIEKILDRLDESSAVVIINAVYFKGLWENPFDKRLTADADFKLSSSSNVPVPMMQKTGNFALATGPGYKAIRLAYQPAAVGMVIVLPDQVDGLGKVTAALSLNKQAQLFVALKEAPPRPVELAMPRFKAVFNKDLTKPFAQLGLKLVFSEHQADFSGMTGQRPHDPPLKISQIAHRAMIEVSEEGTEAAAASAVEIAKRGITVGRPPEPFHINHPFLFYIVDDATGAVLFQGRITDPR